MQENDLERKLGFFGPLESDEAHTYTCAKVTTILYFTVDLIIKDSHRDGMSESNKKNF